MEIVNVWIGIVALVVILYVILDGFSLGIGILFPFTRNEEERNTLMETIAPVWDANQTWLVFGGAGLFVAFPLIYGVMFSALYVPLITLLYGLIFRGVSLEFRLASSRKQMWDRAFFAGSLVAVISQGLTLGGVIAGIKVVGTDFAGATFDWLSPFSLLLAAGLVAGYILLGAGYLIIKTTGIVQERAYTQAFNAAIVVLLFQIVMVLWTPSIYPRSVLNWTSEPRVYFIWIFPVLSILSFVGIMMSVTRKKELLPFIFSAVFFFSGYLALFTSLYPYALPPDITFYEAAAQKETLEFTLRGAVIILPVVLAYTIYSYRVFRGKAGGEGAYH